MSIAKDLEEDMEKMLKEKGINLELEGRLNAIIEVGRTFKSMNNGVFGPGGHCWNEKTGHYSKLQVMVDEKPKIIEYDGIILPDSIGNHTFVYDQKGRTLIYDPNNSRWYK